LRVSIVLVECLGYGDLPCIPHHAKALLSENRDTFKNNINHTYFQMDPDKFLRQIACISDR
jgi:hypothetical protein